MAIEPIKGFYVHDEETDTDGVAKVDIDGVSGLPSTLEQVEQAPTTISYNAYIDATRKVIIEEPNSKTYLFDISAPETNIDYYKIHVENNNRFRLLALAVSIDDVFLNSNGVLGSTGPYTDHGVIKDLTIYKSDFSQYKTIAITTNYQQTPPATFNVVSHHLGNLWDVTDRLEYAVNDMSLEFNGNPILAESNIGLIQFNSIPSDGCEITSIGQNLFNYKTAQLGTISSTTGEDADYNGAIRSEDFIPVVPGDSISLSSKRQIYIFRLAIYDDNKDFISRIEMSPSLNEITGRYGGQLTIPNGGCFARLTFVTGSVKPWFTIQSVGVMLSFGNGYPAFEDYQTSTVTVENGEVVGELWAYRKKTYVFTNNDDELNINIPVNPVNLISKYHSTTTEETYTDNECRNRFRLAMREKATRIGMTGTTVGDGAGHPVRTSITAIDAIKMLTQALGYGDINDTWTYDTKIIRTKGVVDTITLESTLFTDTYISDLTDYYTVLGFKTGAGDLHNLVCACTSDSLNGKMLVGCISLTQVTDDANINRPKAMKVLMDLGVAKCNDRNADVSTYVSQLTAMTAQHFSIVLLPNCNNPRLLSRYDFESNYSLLYNYSSTTFTSFSMIKLLCAMTALDYLDDLDEENEVVYSDLLIGTGAYGPLFEVGEIITFRDALSALLIHSSNQASYFLERLVGKKILEKYGEDGFLPTE